MSTAKPKIAFIDDEERILRTLKMHFRSTHDVFTTTCPTEFIDHIRHNEVDVVVSDQRMPEKLGVELLKEVKEISPNTVRILLTGYADLNAVVNSINEGEIFRYITKPWNNDELNHIVTQATQIALQTKSVSEQPFLLPPELANDASPLSNLTDRRVLIIDDHEAVYEQMKNTFSQFDIHWANSLEKAYELLGKYQFGVAIADVSLNGENIAPIIYSLKQGYPELAVLMLTEFKDAHTLIDLINKGQVYRCLPRPSNLAMLELSIQRAFKHHAELVAQPKLQIRHTVADVTETEKSRFSDKIKGFFARFRSKNASYA